MSSFAPASMPYQRVKTSDDAALGLRLGLGLALTAMLALTITVYAMPMGASAHYWGLDREGQQQFRIHWGLSALPRLGMDSYSTLFRALLVVFWSGYALVVLSVLKGAEVCPKRLIGLIIGTAAFTAIFFPPLLSHDVYAYAAQGRLSALYGQNPYFVLPSYLKQVHDPVAVYVTWDTPSVYGSIWTRIEILLAAIMHGQGVLALVLALKLVEAAVLIAAALAGRRIAARLSPGKENVTLLAIGLNPLLLLEGPGSGHNDLLLVALLMIGAMFYLEGRYFLAMIFLGFSVGIKLITLAVLPWAWMEWARGRTWQNKISGGIIAFALALLPTALFYIGLWHGISTLAAIQSRSAFHADSATLLQNSALRAWLLGHGVERFTASCLVTVFQNRWEAAAFVLLTLWLSLRPQFAQWLTAWCLMAALLMFFSLGLPFPWYICWFWPVCLTRWDRVGMILSAASFGLSLTWMAGYAVMNS